MTEIKLEQNGAKHYFFNLYVDGSKAGEMAVNVNSMNLTVYHTEVFPRYEHEGYAGQLLDVMVSYAREHHLMIIPLCTYVYTQLRRHPDKYADVWRGESQS